MWYITTTCTDFYNTRQESDVILLCQREGRKVCWLLSVSCISQMTWPNITNFLDMLTVAVSLSTSCSAAIRYILPVLCMLSCFTLWCVMYSQVMRLQIQTKFCSIKKPSAHRGLLLSMTKLFQMSSVSKFLQMLSVSEEASPILTFYFSSKFLHINSVFVKWKKN